MITAALVAALVPATAMAKDTPPPADAMKLSEVISALEERVGDELSHIDEIDWDEDGYWEIEYVRTDGAQVEVKIDPTTGDARN
ncbi:PepSY domain-containing protein [Pelagivirga sediminicola]|uniref:PepSY domain-containing protein n=2 Tax=Pelagivirga sediminicola TaxID=2170575 RepID=A0A2T7GC97_9RHOB|nr:PepSY domain-containing protein [Pelagivirga sediminicola]